MNNENFDLVTNDENEEFTVEFGEVINDGGTHDYDELDNKPQINGNTLEGNKTNEQLGIPVYTEGTGIKLSGNTISADTGVLATKADLNSKQNVIADLPQIRSGAEAGATAVQPEDLARIATTGSYNDSLDKPSINNVTLTGNKSPSEATFSYKDEVLVPGKKYYSFCPYTDLLSESTPQNIEISYEGQTMDKFLDADDNITHIGNYDFLYASTVIPTDTATIPEFGFKRIGALIRLKIDLPELNAIYKKMTFTALEEPQTINQFVVGGRLDMDSGRLYDVKKSPEMTLYLDNIVATEEDFDNEIAKMAEMYKMEADKLKSFMGEAEIKQMEDFIARN